MKKIFFLITNIVLASFLSINSSAIAMATPNFDVSANTVYLYNLDTETLIYEKNSEEKAVPASLTKIMTCILALENTKDLDAEILTYPNYVQDFLYIYQYKEGNGEVSKGGLMAGEELPMRQMLYALMLPSANEAAMIIADHLGGSQEKFAEMMNTRAKELGAQNTNFVNPNGLYAENHVTTAKDMFLIARHAMELPGFMEIVSTTKQVYGPSNLHTELVWNTTNQMIVESSQYFYPGLNGIKTGTLPQSGRCFISTATKDGFTYLLVVMGAPINNADGKPLDQNMAFVETKKLYDWVFDTFKRKRLVEKGKFITEIPLHLSLEKDFIPLMTADIFTALVPKDIEASSVTFVFDIPEFIEAPIKKNDVVGVVKLVLAGEQIGEINLLASETVAASPVLIVLQKVQNVLKSFWFKFIAIFILFLIVAYIALLIIRHRNLKKSGYKPRRRI